jgi:hypothetical protein
MTQAQAGMQECLVVFVRSVEVFYEPPRARAIEIQECGPNVAPSWRGIFATDHGHEPFKGGLCASFSAGSRYMTSAKEQIGRINNASSVTHALIVCNRGAMLERVNVTPTPQRRLPWNKGKLIGAKPPLRPKHVWSIRTKLQIEGRVRDLAMFNLAIDSKLRGCDVVAIRVEDVAAGGYTADRPTVRQKKTGQPVRFELSEQTRQAIDDYLWSYRAGKTA